MDNRYRSVRMAEDHRRDAKGIGAGAGAIVRTIIGLTVALSAIVIILSFIQPYLVAEMRNQILSLLR